MGRMSGQIYGSSSDRSGVVRDFHVAGGAKIYKRDRLPENKKKF
jgi:hypothetical protein